MNFDKNKAFPYPVLRPQNDDFENAEFQTVVDFYIEKEKLIAQILYAISSEEIEDEIEHENALYVSVLSCRNTYFQKVLYSKTNKIVTYFDLDEMRGEVRVDSYVMACHEIPSFESPDINPEFGQGPFSYSVGDVLAQDESQIFFIDRDLFRPVTSVFELVKKDELSGGEWTIGFEEEHVQIQVSPGMKETIDNARNTKNNKVILMNSIYFAAVMQAVQKLKDSFEEFGNRKWAEVISRQAHNINCDLELNDAYLIANRLMKRPLILLETYIFKGSE